MQDEYWLSYAVTAFLENFWYLVVAMFGAVVGSFLGVVIYRLPIKELTPPEQLPNGYSLSNPPSYCPHCKHVLSWWENVPIFGFLMLRGRCFECKKAIPWRDFAMEILTASAWVAIFHIYNGNNLVDWVNVILLALFASMLIAAVFIDLDHFIVPESLNRFGLVVGLLRDIAVLGVAWLLFRFPMPTDWPVRGSGLMLLQEVQNKYMYFGWLPRGFVGAIVYGGVLFMVSLLGFVYYARGEGESLVSVTRRFFTYEDFPEPNKEGEVQEVAVPQASGLADLQKALTNPNVKGFTSPNVFVVSEQPAEPESEQLPLRYAVPDPVVEKPVVENPVVEKAATEPEQEEEEDDSPPIRLRFSPGFITLLSAGFLAIVVGWWSLLAVVLPLVWFIALTRTKDETVGDALRRFFKADDLPYEYDAPTMDLGMPVAAPTKKAPVNDDLITGANVKQLVWDKNEPIPAVAGSPSIPVPIEDPITSSGPLSFADAQAEADQFAKEAESGAHGGMGLGDVKLALAIGGILGPGGAMLSLFFATLLGATTGIALKIIHRKPQLRFGVPFVPFMAAGAFLTLLFGQQIINWYTSFYVSTPDRPAITGQPNGPRMLPNGTVELPSDRNLREYNQRMQQQHR